MARRNRQCPRSLGLVYDADEEPADPDERPPVDWDAWERDRLKSPYTRIWMITMAVMALVLTISLIKGGGSFGP